MRIVPQISGTHRHHFRSGEWATITGIKLVVGPRWAGLRPCYEVVFPDGKTDVWAVHDVGYEFRNYTLKESEDLTLLYVNFGPDGASAVVRDNVTGQTIDIPGGPIDVQVVEEK